ncbi:MAG: hypothetical protein OXJ64_10625 [Boseongicola sp.]|nr:hypothetical protein [Boseongicola sp.]
MPEIKWGIVAVADPMLVAERILAGSHAAALALMEKVKGKFARLQVQP